MSRRRRALVAASALSVTAGLLVGVAPTAMAVEPGAGVPTTAPAAQPASAPSTGERVTDLRDGLCTRDLPLGLVRFDGPGGTRLTARVRSEGKVKLITVLGGTGRIGQTVVRSDDVSGQLTWAKGALSGSVTIDLPEHTKVSRTWDQDVTVTAQPVGCSWAANVALRARGNGASLDLRGSLTDAGSYLLRGTGQVTISRTKVPVTGYLRATSPGRSASTSWRVTGATARAVTMPGARLEQVRVALTSARPVVGGSARLVLQDPLLTAPATLEIAGADTWSARVEGAHRKQWIMPGTESVVVNTGELRGSVGMRAGRPHWTLTAPGQTTIGTLTYSVDVGFVGRDTYTVQARYASGTFLGLPDSRPFEGVATQLRITPKGATGALSVATRGEVLLDFPGAWTATTDYIVEPVPGQAWQFQARLRHTLRSGLGAIHFTGPVSPDGAVTLIARGHKEIHGTLVPVRGYYNRTSWTDGSLPVWALAAYKEEVEGGRIPIKGGAAFLGGMVAWTGPGSQHHSTIGNAAAIRSARAVPTSEVITVPPVTGSGTTTLQLSDADGETFSLPISYTYVDADNWTATAAGTTPDNVYNPFTGLEIPETAFSGTVTEAQGVQTWDMTISMQEWQDMAKGIQFKGSFTVSNTCPLAEQENCPDGDGIFIGGDSTLDFTDASFPSATSNGAFLTDLSWGWWDGTANGSVSLAGITMANPDITIWRGTGTGPSDDIVLPDLSSDNGNGMNVEFCAAFSVPVPYVATVNTLGCAAWTDEGVILAQVNTGGSITTSDYNDVNVSSTGLVGYVFNGLPDTETVFLDGTEVVADPNKNYVTADIAIPGNLMHDFGTGSSDDAVITALGWFDLDGNFSIEGTIPVNLSGGGFTLDEIVITMSRTKDDGLEDFNLVFDAECDVVINGNHFPLDVYIGYQKEGDSTVTVGLSASGTASTQPEGTMDFVNLVPTGDFEPENASLVDGSFDGKLPANIPNDGGFERSVDPGDVVVNGSFDDSMGLNAVPDGDFEDGTYNNILANSNFEDTNVLLNGDFEDNGGSLLGWQVQAGYPSPSTNATAVPGSAVGPTDSGSTVAQLLNPSVSNNTTEGLYQPLMNVDLANTEATLSAWVLATSTAATEITISFYAANCSSATSFAETVSVTSTQWVQVSASGALGPGCKGGDVIFAVNNPGTGVLIDAVELGVTSGSTVPAPTVWRPNVVGTFDSLSTTPLQSGYSSNVAIATDYPGTLFSNGESSWMMFPNSTGKAAGDFDVSYKVLFPTTTTSREIADFGFWLDGDYSTMKGFCFRLQTANGDGGFIECSKTSKTFIGSKKAPDVTRGIWYQVRLTATGDIVTAYVTDLSDEGYVFTDSFNVYDTASSVTNGTFGQVPDAISTSQGIRWDDLTYYSLEAESFSSPGSYQPNVVYLNASDAHTGTGRASLFTHAMSGQVFEYSTSETPSVGEYYSYSVWMRAATGTVSGSISLSALGGTTEIATTTYEVGTTWTQVSVTLEVSQGGHDDLRPRITVTSTNAELQIDDQMLQQVPWVAYNANSSAVIEQVTSAQAYTGTNSMAIMDPGNDGGTVLYQWDTPGAAGEVLTASAWVLAPSGVSGQLRIVEQAGASKKAFTANGTWQQVTIARTLQGGSDNLYLAVDVDSGESYEMLYVDDVVVTGTANNSAEIGVAIPPPPGGWTSALDVLPGTIAPTSSRVVAQSSSFTPAAPTNVQASYSNFAVTISWSAASAPASPVTGYKVKTSTGQSVCNLSTPQLSCTVTGLAAGTYQFTVNASNWYGGGTWSQPSNEVVVYESIAPVIVSDSSLARTGQGSLVLRPGAGGTQIDTYTVTPETAPALGSTWQASVWLASGTANNSQPVTVTFSAGSSSTSVPVTLPSSKGTYANVTVDLPITAAATSFSVAFSYFDATGSNTVFVDDLSITEIGLSLVDDWQAAETNGFVAMQGVDDSMTAHSGDGYMLIDNTSTQAVGVFLDGAYKATSGTAHEFSVWLRSPGANVAGDLWLRTFDANGNSLDSYQVPFTATSQWGFFFVSLPITNTNAVTIRTEIDVPAGSTLYVDDLESRDVNYWSAAQPSSGKSSIVIVDNSGQAANGQNYLRFITSGSGGGVRDVITADTAGNPIDVIAGSSYKLEAYVRSTTGKSVSGTMSLATGNGNSPADGTSVPFTAGASWTPVQLTLDTTKNADTMLPKITLDSAGMLDVDEVTLIPVLIEQSDPWSATGPGVTWGVYDDPPNAYDSSYGVMEFSVSTAGSGVEHSVAQTTSVGDQLSATAFVRTVGRSVSGTFQVTTTGGTQEVFKQTFTANVEWQAVSIPITITQSGHTGFTVSVTLNTTGQTLYLDQVALQTNPWTPLTGATQAIVFDGASAQSGSGYLNLASSSGQNASTYLDMAASSDIGGTYGANETWTATFYLRSTGETELAAGHVSLGAPDGGSTTSNFSVGSEWTPVTVSYPVGATALDSLRAQVTLFGDSVSVDMDSVTISDGTAPPDGTTTPLPHANSGWVYLWDDAFGIPGMHLWAISAQVDFVDGDPGLGVSATTYQDPAGMPNVMHGEDWMKGDMAVNISETDPCFLFDFESDGGDSYVSLGEGVFRASDFSINFAPRGCQVGPYTLAKGASLSFDGQFGDGTVNFDIAITEGDDGPEFTEDIGITDITIGGFDFKEMELSILLTETDDSITFVGDMVTPMGNFNGSYDLDASENALIMDGSVSLTDWGWVGGGFDVEEFDYDMSMTVPLGAGECGSFSEDASGLMDMGEKTSLSFTGQIAMNCGKLEVLEMEYDYKHGAITEIFELDYDASTGILAGEVAFDFERSTSWKFFFHRYNRHPKFAITLAYSMDVEKPSTASASLTGEVSLSGGSGEVQCSLEVGTGTDWADDYCSLYVHITIGGGHTYSATW